MTRGARGALGVAALSAVAIALPGCAAAMVNPRAASPAPGSVPSPSASTTGTANQALSDGTYTAEGEYGNLPSHIGVTATLADGVITSVTVTPRATNPTSLGLQKDFAEAVPGVVIGRPIQEIELDRVAGSSGTTQGFNDALRQIIDDAGTAP